MTGRMGWDGTKIYLNIIVCGELYLSPARKFGQNHLQGKVKTSLVHESLERSQIRNKARLDFINIPTVSPLTNLNWIRD